MSDAQLPQQLGLLDATMIIVGIVSGSGLFSLPSLVARSLPSSAAILSVWTISGVLFLLGALAYAGLGAVLAGRTMGPVRATLLSNTVLLIEGTRSVDVPACELN